MRLAKLSRSLWMLALPAVFATCALAQEHPNVQPNAVRDQLMKQGSGGNQSSPSPAANAPAPEKRKPSPKAASSAAKSSAAAKPVAKTASSKPTKAPVEKPAEEKVSVTRRDPFDTLLNKARSGDAPPENLPPGKAGLVVGTLRIDGIVHSSTGMIAIVSNPQQRVYFLREGDKLYDGSVDKIALDAISFHEFGKDAFGKPLERQVTKRLYPSSGESQ